MPRSRAPATHKPRAARAPAAAREPPTTARVRLPTDQRRAQLVELGIEAFSRRPYDEVSVDDVASEAGISKGLLYHYFSTKRDFYVETVREVAARLLVSTAPDPALPPLAQVETGLRAYLDFARRRGAVYASLVRGGVGADREVTRVMEEARETFVARMLEHVPSAVVTPLLRLTLRGWIGFVEATALEWIVKRDVEAERLLELWIGLLIEALSRVAPGLAPMTR